VKSFKGGLLERAKEDKLLPQRMAVTQERLNFKSPQTSGQPMNRGILQNVGAANNNRSPSHLKAGAAKS
jgi:hypothetical protein